MINRRRFIQIGAGGLVAISSSRLAFAAASSTVNLRIVGTTDVHGFLTDFDYYKDAPTEKFGFSRAANLIKQAREEVPNSVLVDNGDLIQGNPISDYQAAVGAKEGRPEPSIMALNAMKYDVGTLGNHEFNYGLPYLETAMKEAEFPIINANIVKAGTEEPAFQPYFIQEKEVLAENGTKHTVKIGYIGFVPPQVMIWDKANLEGKVEARDIVKTAEKYVPLIKEAGRILLLLWRIPVLPTIPIRKARKIPLSIWRMWQALMRLFSDIPTAYSLTKNLHNRRMPILTKARSKACRRQWQVIGQTISA